MRASPEVSSRQLRAVIALAQFRSFVAAAAALGMSQPALSRAIQRLERSLGVALFRRSTRLVALTAAGRDFLPTAERLLHDLDRHLGSMRELANQQRGYVVVASLMSLAYHVLPAATAAYRRRFPGIDLHLREGVQDAIVADVRGAVADLGIANVGDVTHPLVVEPLGDEPCLLVSRAGIAWPGSGPCRSPTSRASLSSRCRRSRACGVSSTASRWRRGCVFTTRSR